MKTRNDRAHSPVKFILPSERGLPFVSKMLHSGNVPHPRALQSYLFVPYHCHCPYLSPSLSPTLFSARSLGGCISRDTVHERATAFRDITFMESSWKLKPAVATCTSRFIKLTTYLPACTRCFPILMRRIMKKKNGADCSRRNVWNINFSMQNSGPNSVSIAVVYCFVTIYKLTRVRHFNNSWKLKFNSAENVLHKSLNV